jgi:lipoprotein-releasing system ATP-binding protein
MSQPLLEARKISKIFRKPVEFQALKDIDLTIYKSEFVSIIGESGSGKSTLLYILATLDTDYLGELYFNEERLTGRTRSQLAIFRNENLGFIFQFHYLLPEFTVMENVLMPALKLNAVSVKEMEHNAKRLLERLNLSAQAHKRANQLSGGQQQRVAIARALINKPRLLVADEPTGNLDSKNSQIVIEIFRELVYEERQSILVVTHDLHFAQKTDRIIRMRDGEIISTETTNPKLEVPLT